MNEFASLLNNIIRTGWVSSVNAEERTARVSFEDKGQILVSGPLKVLNNSPFIPAAGAVQQTEAAAGGSGETAFESHTHQVKVSPWIPAPKDFVLCIFLPNGDGDGFVIGGI